MNEPHYDIYIMKLETKKKLIGHKFLRKFLFVFKGRFLS